MLKKILLGLLLALIAAALYLTLWPVPVDPEAWTPTPAKAAEGVWAANDKLAGGEILAPTLEAPEAVAVDLQGRLYTGTRDGRVVRIDGDQVDVLARTGGRPLGIKLAPDGTVYVADADVGLLRVADGSTTILAEGQGERPFRFTDDLTILADGSIIFTDASSRWTLKEFRMDVLEHRPWGRLLRYDPAAKSTELIADGLYFPNGVAAAPDGASVMVCETSSYRVLRVWLTPDKRGQREVVLDGLPGFCDNITWSSSRNGYWVAIGAPRDPTLDKVSPSPFWRKVIYRLPRVLHPKEKKRAMAILMQGDGTVLHVLTDPDPNGYGPIASVLEHAGSLYLGSFMASGIKKVAAP